MEKLKKVDTWICLAACQANPGANRHKSRRWMLSKICARSWMVTFCASVTLLLVFTVLNHFWFTSSRQVQGMPAEAKMDSLPIFIIEVAYPFWRQDTIPPGEIPFDRIHQISHVFVLPGAKGALDVPAGFEMPQLIEMAHAANRKVNLGVGGANSYEEFAAMTVDPLDRAAFIQELTAFVLQNEYDGIEIDWEFPKSSAERNNLTDFIIELREKTQETGRAIQLTLVVSKNDWFGQWIDVEMVLPYVDYFLVMTFNYHGPLSIYSGHNAPMYPPDFEPDSMGLDGSIRYWVETRGVPPAKILLGLATFGVSFDSEVLYAPFNQTEQSDYGSIQSLIGKGYTRNWDAVSLVPYLTQDIGSWLWSYDDVESMGIKCDLVVQKGLRGVAIWDITGDFNNNRHDLIEAVAQKFDVSYIFLPVIYYSSEVEEQSDDGPVAWR